MKGQTILGKLVFWVLVVTIVVWMLFPFYWAINSSLKSEAQLQMTPATFVPRSPTTQSIAPYFTNYIAVFSNPQFIRGLLNSAVVAVSVTLMALAIGAFAAFALGKLRFRGKTPSLYLVLAMTMFPQIAVLSGLYAMKQALSVSAVPSMIITYMIFTLPFTVWVLTSFFKGLPMEIMQAAQVDGATGLQTFQKILLPLTGPALVTTGLLAFIAAWNEYLFALTFTSVAPEARTLPVIIANFPAQAIRQTPFGQIMAAGIISSIPLIILVFAFQRRIVAGLTAGAVKG
jgi:trehalose/maltose transport system permease protein